MRAFIPIYRLFLACQWCDIRHYLCNLSCNGNLRYNTDLFCHTRIKNEKAIMADIFLSYSHRDKLFVRRLVDALAAQKRNTWEDIPPTAEWRAEVFGRA